MSNVKPNVKLAREFLDELLRCSSDGTGGVMRIAYGSGEQEAHDTLISFARNCGFPVEQDFAGNSYVRLKGRDPSA